MVFYHSYCDMINDNNIKKHKTILIHLLNMNAVSGEQQYIIDMVQQEKNVQVDACAGSGKSTTILSTAKSMPDKQFLLITYNKSLRKEIKEKVDELELKNITVHTYHSLAVAIYNKDGHKDKEMRLIIARNDPPLSKKKHDIIVLDEVQDMRFLFYRFVIKYITDMGNKIQIMILGDYMQGLYEFQGSDIRFLTMANEIWKEYNYLRTSEFEMCQLKTSYRITNQMADFVNEAMLDEKRLYACREGDPVCYIRRWITELQKIVVHTIQDLITNHNVKPSDIFVLAGSVKSTNSNITQIENALVEAGIPCHVPMLENSDNIDDDVIKGKVVFSTFHTSKGRQREYVFVLGFDNSYFKTNARTLDPTKCPNTLYVATTRAQKRLYLLEIYNRYNGPLEFLKQTHLQMNSKPYIDFRGTRIPQTKFEDDANGLLKEKEFIPKTTPTKMTQHISESVLDEITELLDEIFIPVITNQPEIELPSVLITKKGFSEDVSDLNGIAIPSFFYDYIRDLFENQSDTCILYEMIQEGIANIDKDKHLYLKEIVKKLNPTCKSAEDYLYMANVYQAVQEKLYFRLKQIERDEYNWLTEDVLEKCKQRLINVLENEIGEVEQPLMERSIIDDSDEEAQKKIAECLSQYFPANKQYKFSARVDLITETTLWELKCTSEIAIEHMIQTVVYAWIMRTIEPAFSKKVKILNVRTGEVLELVAEKASLDKIVVSLLRGKYEKPKVLSDEEFLKECHECFETCSQNDE